MAVKVHTKGSCAYRKIAWDYGAYHTVAAVHAKGSGVHHKITQEKGACHTVAAVHIER
jgi:hypothetical protein